MKTLTMNTTATTAIANPSAKVVEHLSLNSAGSMRVTVEGKEGGASGRRICDCNNCRHCREHSNPVNFVHVQFGIQSYNGRVMSDNETIAFPSVEAFKEFAQFVSKVDIDTMFKPETEKAKAAA